MFEDPPGISLILNGGENFVRYRLFMSRPQSVGVTSSYKNMFYIKSYTNSQIQDEFNVLPDILAVFKNIPSRHKVILASGCSAHPIGAIPEKLLQW